MKIAFILGGLRIGGYEILTVNIANALANEGFRVWIIALSDEDAILNRINENVSVLFFPRKSKFDLSPLRKLRNFFKTTSPDIILSSDYIEFILSKLSCFHLKKAPVFIIAFHLTKPPTAKDDCWNAAYAFINRFFNNQHIAIHRSQIDFYSQKYGLKRDSFHLIYNGVDTDFFSAKGEKKFLKNGKLNLIHVANLKPLKDQWTLLKAMVELNQLLDNWQLKVAGADVEGLQEDYIRFAEENHISDKIKFLGPVNNVKEYLQDADLFILTSTTEALSVAMIEAISMGVPAIVTDIGGNPEIISNEVEGFLVTIGDAKAIAEKVNYLYQNQSILNSMSVNARQKAVNCFNFNKMIENYIKLFQKLLSNNYYFYINTKITEN